MLLPETNLKHTEIAKLQQQAMILKQENETLFNCWQHAELKYSQLMVTHLKLLREKDALQNEVKELNNHLNPQN